ncbi:hypothetical protein BJ741DRAFT_655104, partial [Chytriomyces cf. hyalinus JEL632]
MSVRTSSDGVSAVGAAPNFSALPPITREVLKTIFNANGDLVRIGIYYESDGSASPAISVFDLLNNVCGMGEGTRKEWYRIQNPSENEHEENVPGIGANMPGIRGDSPRIPVIDYQMFNFPGKKATPVVKLATAVQIMYRLPGPVAKAFRLANADVFTRYLGGDTTLKAEVDAINAAHTENPDNGARAFRLDVEHRNSELEYKKESERILAKYAQSETDVVYLGLISSANSTPPDDIESESAVVQKVAYPIPNFDMVKFGMTSNLMERNKQHVRDFGDFVFIKVIPTHNARKLERAIKDDALFKLNQGLFRNKS